MFARIIHGARTSLWIGFVATAFSLLLGGALGAIAGYVGGWLDELIMRIMDVMLCLPEMLLAIAITTVIGIPFGVTTWSNSQSISETFW